MPGMSGVDLEEVVRRQYPNIKIVSGYVRAEAAPNGFPFLLKPWRLNEVEKAITLA